MTNKAVAEMTGSGDWATAFNKATDAVANLTIEEKVSLEHGKIDDSDPRLTKRHEQVKLTSGVKHKSTCSGNVPAIDSIDFPGLCLSDAGQGLRNTDFVSSFPSGIHVAARYVIVKYPILTSYHSSIRAVLT